MKRLLYFGLILIIRTQVYSQVDSTKVGPFEVHVNGQWIVSEDAVAPRSIGIVEFITSNLEYPTQARRMGIEGNTVIEIQISPDGTMTKYTVLNHIGADTDKELLRIGSVLPTKWTPAYFQEKSVKSKVLILIKFSLFGESSLPLKDIFYKAFVAKPISTTSTQVLNANDLGIQHDNRKKKKKSKTKT